MVIQLFTRTPGQNLFLNYNGFTHIGQSKCNISEITNRKTQLRRFGAEHSKIQNVISPLLLRYGQTVFSF